ncbi:MAG: HepT-like ribonuclease domain-containing protein [Burkholderiales bacterium]
MSGGALRVPDYLDHMLQAIRRIGRYAGAMDEAAFLKDELVQDAVIRNIEVIGEAARNIERVHPDFSAQHPDVPWADIYLMRNRVAHGYFTVDLEIIWRTVKRDVPVLERQIAGLLSRVADRDQGEGGPGAPG